MVKRIIISFGPKRPIVKLKWVRSPLSRFFFRTFSSPPITSVSFRSVYPTVDVVRNISKLQAFTKKKTQNALYDAQNINPTIRFIIQSINQNPAEIKTQEKDSETRLGFKTF